MAEPVAKSPALRALQREDPPAIPSAPGTAASVRSGRDLMSSREDQRTVFVPQPLFAYCTSPDYTVTAALANSTIDSPVRVIAEHLFGLACGSFQLWTGEQDVHSTSTPKGGPALKGVKGWLGRLNLRSKRATAAAAAEHKTRSDNESSRTVSDDSDADPATEDYWAKIRPLTDKERAEVRRCGKWRGAEPSDKFLNIYAQALLTLEKNVLNGLVSPSLVGQSGVVPVTIISHSSDIVQHYCDMIVRAEHEIFFTTNVWEASESSRAISTALKELSQRVIDRGGDKIVMKLMYDRGVPKEGQAHQTVVPSVYTAENIGLPAPQDIPGVHLEVQNYHIPPVGSFHQKTIVIDRKVALLSSNNVQNRSDVGFMVHLEGPIVQSIYDSSILAWWRSFNPRLPLLANPPEYSDDLDRSGFQFGTEHAGVSIKGDLSAMAERSRLRLSRAPSANTTPLNSVTPVRSRSIGSSGRSHSRVASPAGSALNGSAVPLVRPTSVATSVASGSLGPKDLVPAVATLGLENGPPSNTTSSQSLTPVPNGSADATPFNPLVVHAPHDPFPIALVNRTPRGRRGHGDAYVPQNQAWLAGFKFAHKSVFIQTPTFSARPTVAAALDAVRRGVVVEIYADLGISDAGEGSAEGTTNQTVAAYMYAQLTAAQRPNLRIYWYTAKGENTPLSSHTCHIKLMIVDEQIGVQGNGRQDASSWYHAQEINILIDSAQVCAEWRRGIDANQDTRLHGRVGEDGVWRDADGLTLPVPAPTPLTAQVSPVARKV